MRFNQEILRKALDIRKATINSPDTGWIQGVAGVLEQEEVQRAIAQIVDYLNPVRQNMPRVPGRGSAYKFTTRTAGTTPGAFVTETTDYTASTRSDSLRDRTTYSYKTLAVRGRIGRFAQRVGESLYDIMADELEGKATDFRDFEDQQIFRANAPSATTGAFDGLDKLLGICGLGGAATGTTYTNQVINPSGTVAAVGATLTANLMDQLLDKVVHGTPNAIIVSRAGKRAIQRLIHSQAQYPNTVQVPGGHIVPTWNGIPILVSTNISDAISSNGSTWTSYSGGCFTAIYAVSFDEVFIAELTGLTTMAIPQVTAQYEEFEMFEDIVPIYRRRGGLAVLNNINPTLGTTFPTG